MDVDRYLARLSYAGPRDPSIDTLRALHRAHLLAVPFENLSIHTGETIRLEESWLFDKIVTRRRGGFCYELNGLFSALLRTLGFRVDRLAARVIGADGQPGIPFDHMTLRVRLDRDWLADVGFGDCFVEPLPLELDTVTSDGRRNYRMRSVGDEFMLEEEHDDLWKPQYLASPIVYDLRDFEPGCTYHQTSPRSHFTQRRVCSRMTETGRVTVNDRMHKITHADGTRTETAIDEARLRALLARDFGIELEGYKTGGTQ